MPHTRTRHLNQLIKKTLKYSPITGIFGHRQVGKTTLASQFAGQYTTLDQKLSFDQACRDPEGFLKRFEMGKNSTSTKSAGIPVIIDECQLAPPLFPALKDYVRTHPKPGQFLLTGSVRFSSRKAIKESLTGRLIAWELLPMNLSELYETKISDSFIKLFLAKTLEIELKAKNYFSHKVYREYLEKGGLPGLFAVRDLGIREQKFETQLNTILDRDLKLILQTTLPYASVRLLLATLAKNQGFPLELTHLSRQCRISVPTLKKLLNAFEAMFLIRLVPTQGTESKPVVFLEDQGEASFLSGYQTHTLSDLLRFIYANLRPTIFTQTSLMGMRAEFFQYRNRGGAHVPLAICVSDTTKKYFVGIIPILETTPSQHDLGSSYSFLKKYPNSKILFVTLEEADKIVSSTMRIIDVGKLV